VSFDLGGGGEGGGGDDGGGGDGELITQTKNIKI